MFEYYRERLENYDDIFILNNKILKGLMSKSLLKMSDLKKFKMPSSMEDIVPNIEEMSGEAKLLTDVVSETLGIDSFLKVDRALINTETLIGEDFIIVNRVYYTTNPLSGYVNTLRSNLKSYNSNEILISKIGYISTLDFESLKEDLARSEKHMDHLNISKIRIENILIETLNKAAEYKANGLQLFYRDGYLQSLYIMGNQIFEKKMEKISVNNFKSIASYLIDFFGEKEVLINEYKSKKYKLKLSTSIVNEGLSELPALFIKVADLNSSITDLSDRFKLERRDDKALEKAINTPYGLFVISSKTNRKEVMYSYLKKEKSIHPNARLLFLENEIDKDFSDITQSEKYKTLESWKSLDLSSYSTIAFDEISTSEEIDFVLNLTSKGKKVIIGFNSNSSIDAFSSLYNKIGNKSILVDNLLGILQVEKINKVCPSCSKSTPLFQDAQFQEFSGMENIPKMSQLIKVESKKGCDACYCGYKGFLEVAEYLENDKILKSALIEGFNIQNLKIEKNSDSWFNIYENALYLLADEVVTTDSIIQGLGFPKKL